MREHSDQFVLNARELTNVITLRRIPFKFESIHKLPLFVYPEYVAEFRNCSLSEVRSPFLSTTLTLRSGDQLFHFAFYRKRNREESESADNTAAGSACLVGQAPKFSRHKEGTSGNACIHAHCCFWHVHCNRDSSSFTLTDVKYGTGVETNEHRIETRLKQIQFGKNTIGYDNYLAAVPK